MKEKILEFYKQQGRRTEIDEKIFKQFPKDIHGIVKTVQNILIHVEQVEAEKIKSEKENRKDRDPKTVKEIFSKIGLDNIKNEIPLEQKSVGICRNFSMLLVSVLREIGIPSRARCGFANYFGGGYFEDHWVAEYWNKNEEKWIKVDAQIDDYWRKKVNIDFAVFNHFNVKKGQFFNGGEMWQLYRQGLVDKSICGFSPFREVGAYYIRGNMLRDFYSLNKIEYIYQETSDFMEKNLILSDDNLEILDEIAILTNSPDEKFDELREAYLTEKFLKPEI